MVALAFDMAGVEQALSASNTVHSGHTIRRLGVWAAALGGAAMVASVAYRVWHQENVAPHYETVPAERRDIASYVTATGTLSPVVEVQVGSVVSGRIKHLYADYNSQVKAGQLIAIIDPQIFESAVAQARARLQSAQADYARAQAVEVNAKLEYERLANLGEAGATAPADVDRARADWLTARAQVTSGRAGIRQARATLDQSIVNLAYTSIRSPIDGIVVSRNVDVGQVVAASLQAPTLFVIAENLQNMEVHTSVAESDVGLLSAGDRAEFFVDAFPGETFHGTIKQVRYEAVTLSNVVTYDALISVQNSDLKLRPGMTANVNFVIAERHNALVIPNRALRFQPSDPALRGDENVPESGRGRGEARAAPVADVQEPNSESKRQRKIWKLSAGTPKPILVVIGISDGTYVEVVDGPLVEGELVIVGEGENTEVPAGQRPHGPPRMF